MDSKRNKKTDIIRTMLLKTVSKNPELFSYFVAIQEAKKLLMQNKIKEMKKSTKDKLTRLLSEG